MSNYYYARPKAAQRRFQNARFENTHPYSNAVSSSAVGSGDSTQADNHAAVPASQQTDVASYVSRQDTLRAEILWTTKICASHYSYKSSDDASRLFAAMFPDSQLQLNKLDPGFSSVPCMPMRSDSNHELSHLARRMSNIAHTMVNSDDYGHRHVPAPSSGPSRGKSGHNSWKGKCLKLIKNMLELEEAKPFREPLNGRKYPGYYLLVPKPIDLSEIVKRFRNGNYRAPHEFASDVRLMFDNLKKYFKNPESPIFIQTQKVSWWFEAEYQRILSTTPSSPSLPGPSVASQGSTSTASPVSDTTKSNTQPRPTTSSLLQGGPNISICVSNKKSAESSSTSDVTHTQSSRVVVLGSPLIVTQSSPMTSPASPIATSSVSSTALASSTSTRPTLTPTQSDKSRRVGQSTHQRSGTSSGGSPKTPASPSSSRPESDSPASPGLPEEAELGMNIEISNIWFGRARTKPQKPLHLSENGFTLHLTKNGIVEPFHVGCEDIVKCMAHLGRNKKQTMFLFVLPNCMKRLEAFNPRFANCSLIAIFAAKLATSQISKLLHIFWVINKTSLFAPVFSEVDQKGALLLLSNIRPEIMLKTNERIQHMIFGSAMPTPEKRSPARGNGPAVIRSNSGSLVEEVPSSPVTCTVTSTVTNTITSSVTSGHQSCHVSSGVSRQNTSTTTTTNSVSTSVATMTMSAPTMCLRTIPPCTNRTVSIGLPVTCAETSHTGANHLAISHAMRSRLAQSLPEDMQQIIRAKYSRLVLPSVACEPTPPVSCFPQVTSAVFTNTASSSVTTTAPSDSAASTENTTPSHQAEPPTPMEEEDDDDVDLQIIDEFLVDSKDTVTHTPKGMLNGDDIMMMSESMSIRCPITQMIMKRPMKNRHCGHSYDYEGVEELIKQRTNKARCPVLGCSNIVPLRMEDMLRDEERWRFIHDKST